MKYYTKEEIQTEAKEKFQKFGEAYMYYESMVLSRDIKIIDLKSIGEIKEILSPVLQKPVDTGGVKPIFSARYDDPKAMETLVKVFHKEKLDKAFGEGGGGVDEILDNLEKAKRGEI